MKKGFSRLVFMLVVGVSFGSIFVQSIASGQYLYIQPMPLKQTDQSLIQEKIFELDSLVKGLRNEIAELPSMYFLNGNLAYKTELLNNLDIVKSELSVNGGIPTSKALQALENVTRRINGIGEFRSPDCDDTMVVSQKVHSVISRQKTIVEDANTVTQSKALTLMGFHVYGTLTYATPSGAVAVDGTVSVYKVEDSGSTLLYTINTPVAQKDTGQMDISPYKGSYDCQVMGTGSYKLVAQATAYGVAYKKTLNILVDGNFAEMNRDLVLK